MIIFLADGRLGNQIFQYAFLKTISKKNETIVCLNVGVCGDNVSEGDAEFLL